MWTVTREQVPYLKPLGGAKCGRQGCTTCEQDVEELPDCTKKNLVYENICVSCNPGAVKKGELEEGRVDVPTIYVGETSRSIFERSKEHWEGARKGAENNHMVKHLRMVHEEEQEPKFAMKVIKHYKTALARQIAEAVRIRRRGGEGAILNSKGEFSRSHIPRLQVPEEDQGAENTERELSAKILKEQDIQWEQNRSRELGDRAILGPKSSPLKRSKEQEDEIPAKKSKRRRKLQHGVLVNWGELPSNQGASAGAPLTPDYREPDRLEQEPDIGGSRFPSSNQDPGATQDWRTLSVEQSRITDYYPAARPTDWPIQDNLADGCTTPPSHTENVISIGEITEENDQQDVTITGGGITRDKDPDVLVSVNTDQSTGETLLNTLNDMSTTPSVVGNTEPDTSVRKPTTGDSVLVTARDHGTEKCTFKRGGQCNLHGTIGTKKIIVWKEWTRKKDGLFGFVRKQKTDYECHYSGGVMTNSGHQEDDSRCSGVAETNLCNPDLVTGKKTRKSALGGETGNLDSNTIKHDQTRSDTIIQRISGVGGDQAGSNWSESQRISEVVKEPD